MQGHASANVSQVTFGNLIEWAEVVMGIDGRYEIDRRPKTLINIARLGILGQEVAGNQELERQKPDSTERTNHGAPVVKRRNQPLPG